MNPSSVKLLERNRVGVIMRIFARSPETVTAQVASALAAVARLDNIRHNGKPVFSRIDLLVSSDQVFEDSDCGLTAERLRSAILGRVNDIPVHVLEVKKGDIYCLLLNYGIATQMEDRVAYSLIVSHHAKEYITEENIDALLAGIAAKARVVGLAVPEIANFVQKGRISTRFSLWHNKSLVSVGGFDMLAVKPKKAESHRGIIVTGWSDEKAKLDGSGEVEFPLAGSEEIIPLLRLTKFFGPSISVVVPSALAQESSFDHTKDIEGYRRHLAMVATKEKRQELMAKTQGESLDVLERSILGIVYIDKI